MGAMLYSAGVLSAPPTTPEALIDMTSALASAVDEWERGTGWVPFLTQAADTTRTYDPPGPERGPVGIYQGVNNLGGGRRLFLNAGVRSITTLKVGVSLTSTGTALTLNRDYWLRPQNATAYDRPYTYIEFAYPQYGNPQSITVLASFGFAVILPDDAWLAILRMAAIEVLPTLELQKFGSLVKWTESDGVSETYNAKPYAALMEAWQAQIDKVRARYARKILA